LGGILALDSARRAGIGFVSHEFFTGDYLMEYFVDWLTRLFQRLGEWAEDREDRDKRRR
jgi:hypothetical protein